MVASDVDDIKKEYDILLNELKMYNPELLNKERVLAITKADLVDDELIKLLKKTLPKKVDVVYISAMTNYNLDKLKDVLWKKMNS
jgi:GTP-binding protein